MQTQTHSRASEYRTESRLGGSAHRADRALFASTRETRLPGLWTAGLDWHQGAPLRAAVVAIVTQATQATDAGFGFGPYPCSKPAVLVKSREEAGITPNAELNSDTLEAPKA